MENLRPSDTCGTIGDLTPVQAQTVAYFRQWTSGPEGQAQVVQTMIDRMGPACADSALAALAHLADLCQRCALCPLRLSGHCAGLDRTERGLADFVACAAFGDREEALMHGFCVMQPHAAFDALPSAQQLGLALLRSDRHATRH